jgi:hypothetical protein
MNDIRKDLQINIEDLEGEFARQPDLFWQYAQQLAVAEANEKNAKYNLEVTEAKLFLFFKDNIEGKVTNDLISSYVKSSDEYKTAYNDYVVAIKEKTLLKMQVEAIVQKRDMLMQLGANQRAEMQNIKIGG